MFLDIHTHNPAFRKQQTQEQLSEIYSIDYRELNDFEYFVQECQCSTSLPLAVGLHPWDIQPDRIDEDLNKLGNIARLDNVLLIGECGLDKWRGPQLEIQAEVFVRQAELADQLKKPLIIHCVKAHGELMALHKKHRFNVPLIIHGYNKSPEMAEQLTDKGFLLSFGEAALHEDKNAFKALQQLYQQGLPFFLETDGSLIPIAIIYEKIANLLKTPTDILKDVIFASWKKIGLQYD